MTDRMQNGLLLSFTLHGAVIALAFFWAYAASLNQKPPVRILELVAGEGTNYSATKAPGGASGATKAPPTPAQNIRRLLANANLRAQRAVAKERAEEEKRLAQEEADRAKNAKAETKPEKSPPTKNTASAQKYSKVEVPKVGKGVAGGSPDVKEGAGGKALERMLASYDEELIAALRAAFEQDKPAVLNDSLVATVTFHVAADGTLSSVRITKPSGNPDFDAAVRAAFRRVGSIGARPDRKAEDVELDFRAKDQDGE